MPKKFLISTWGCQMNVHDSEKIAGIFNDTGYAEAGDLGDADVIVLNTCSIREKAEQKFYSDLGRLKKVKKKNPNLKIAVAGCIAQQSGKELFKIGHPGGIIEVGAVMEVKDGAYHYREAVLGRTARRLMEGSVLIPEKYFADKGKGS